MPAPEQVRAAPTLGMSDLEALQQQLKSSIERENIESIDEVKELILEMYELEKDPSKQRLASRNIPKYQEILDLQIKIIKLMIKDVAAQLKLDGVPTNLDDVQDQIDDKTVLIGTAQKKGDQNKVSKLTSESEKLKNILEMLKEIETIEKAKVGI